MKGGREGGREGGERRERGVGARERGGKGTKEGGAWGVRWQLLQVKLTNRCKKRSTLNVNEVHTLLGAWKYPVACPNDCRCVHGQEAGEPSEGAMSERGEAERGRGEREMYFKGGGREGGGGWCVGGGLFNDALWSVRWTLHSAVAAVNCRPYE